VVYWEAIEMDRKIIIVNVLIHGFAAAHAVTAAALSQTIVGDEAALATLTITMIIAISRVYNRAYDVGQALAVLGVFAGFYMGTRGAATLVKWIPGIGNVANAITTTIVTEILGWATYVIVKEGKNPKNISKSEAQSIWQKAKSLKKEMKEEQEKIKKLISRMSYSDKQKYDQLMERLKNKELSGSEAKRIESELDDLFRKYGY
jgi:uncharacterized protein (DUF697 family)